MEDSGSDAYRALERDGYAIIEGFLPLSQVEALRRALEPELARKRRRAPIRAREGEDRRHAESAGLGIEFRPEGGNHDFNRWNLRLPSRAPFLDPALFAEARVLAALDAFFGGPDYALAIMAADVNMPGSGFQNPHQDHAEPAVSLNVPLVDFELDNGPTEVFPGTHRPAGGGDPPDRAARFALDPDALAARLAETPPVPLLLRAGSAVLRDHRLVHRGTPNRSRSPRPMLTFNYWPRPVRVPPLGAANLTAALAYWMRRRAIGDDGVRDAGLLGVGNAAGQAVFQSRASDRDFRRPIPRELYAALPERGRRLLRFAQVGRLPHRPEPGTDLRAGMDVLRWATDALIDHWLEIDG